MDGTKGTCDDDRRMHPHRCRACGLTVLAGSVVCQEIGLGSCGECSATDWESEAFRIDYEALT